MDTLQSKDFEVLPMFATPLYRGKVKNFDYDFFDKEVKENFANISTVEQYILDDPKYSDLRDEIENHIKNFKEFMGYECDFRITQSWVSFTNYGQSHVEHMHPNSILSGTVYLGEGDNFPAINFIRNTIHEALQIRKYPKETNVFNNEFYSYNPQAGDFLLFESNIKHLVSVNESVKPRLSLAFNTFPCGTIGSYSDSTELRL